MKTLALTTNAADVAVLQREAEADMPAVKAIAVTSAEEYEFADMLLTQIVSKKDAAIAMRKRATGPIKKATTEIESWFRPVVKALETSERHLKESMGAYQVRAAKEEREAREAACVAAAKGDAAAMYDALGVAEKPPPAGRATASMQWEVDTADVTQMDRALLSADWSALKQLCRAAKGSDSPPVACGVTFRQVAKIGARR